MQYVIFSDIHGNLYALRELLAVESKDATKQFIFCGDLCGYYYHAEESMELLKTIDGLIAVRGNHDQYYLNAYKDEEQTEKLVEKYGSSYREKILNLRYYIENMPLEIKLNINGRKVYIQHGSPGNLLEGRVYPDSVIPELEDNAIYISGHTHYQMIKQYKNMIWINPGSLGQPRDGKGFSYCILNDKNWDVFFRNISIDIDPLVHQVRTRDPLNKYLEEELHRNL